MYLLALDPGLRVAGVALFEDETLIRAGIVHNPVEKERGPVAWNGMADAVRAWTNSGSVWHAVDTFVCERPQVYHERFMKGDPDNLIQLAGVCGAVGFMLHATTSQSYKPFEWKRSLSKTEHHAVVLKLLSKEEKARIEECPQTLRHNAEDAVALGLFAVGRKPK